MWHAFKLILFEIIDNVAPLKKFLLKKFNQPWINKEARYHISKKDLLHQKAVNSNTDRSSDCWIAFKTARNLYKSVLRKKMKEYFLDKNCQYFKSSKNFLSFYKRFVKLKKIKLTQQYLTLNYQTTELYLFLR